MAASRANLSRSRQAIMGIVNEIEELAQALIQGDSKMLRASLYQRRRRCGHSGCRCARGHLHKDRVIALRRQGRVIVLGFKKANKIHVVEAIETYRRFRRCRAKLAGAFANLIKEVDRLGRLRETAII